MKIFGIEIPNQLLDLGSLIALIGVPYLIVSHRSDRQNLKFIFSSSAGNYNAGTDEYKWETGGIIKNCSNKENTIVRIYRIVWKNLKRNSYLANSLANIEVLDLASNEKIILPLYLLHKRAYKLRVTTKFNVRGTSDERILSEREEIMPGSRIFLPKHRYELCFEDIDGNFFDQRGKLVNLEEADLWWTLENTFTYLKDWDIFPFFKHSIMITKSKIKFFLKVTLWNLGL